MSCTATETTTKSKTATIKYKKRLEGIAVNDDDVILLLSFWKDAFDIISNQSYFSSNTKENPALRSPKNLIDAVKVLKQYGNPSMDNNNTLIMPIPILKAIEIVFQQTNEKNYHKKIMSLERAAQKASLVFSPPPEQTIETTEQKKFHQRMDRLRLLNEETKYSKLTNNIKDQRKEDDITAKSMTYAASVGLNMIVAPLSFGCFMYFFAGGIFDFLLTNNNTNNNDDETMSTSTSKSGGTDIKRVIVGVVSGVIMMIIEMLLFVIRTHEFEEHNRKKKKSKKGSVEPFGVYSTKTPATYSDGNTSFSHSSVRMTNKDLPKKYVDKKNE